MTNKPKAYHEEIKRTALLMLIAALFRFLYYNAYIEFVPYALYPMNDAKMYWQWGLELYRYGWWMPENQAYYQAPLYPMWIAALHHFGFHSMKDVIGAQLLLGVLNSVLGYWILRQYVSARLAFLFALFLSLSPLLFFYETKITATTLGVTLWLLVLGGLIRWIQSGSLISALFSGICLTLSVLCRPNLIFFLPFIFLVFIKVQSSETSAKSPVRPARLRVHPHGWLAGILVLSGILTVTVRNYLAGGEWVLLTANSGVTLYMGNNPYAMGGLSLVPGLSNDIEEQVEGGVRLASELAGQELTLNRSSRFWMGYTLQYILTHPWEWLVLAGKKLLWSVYYLPPSVNYSIPMESEFLGYIASLSALHILILTLGLVSLFSMQRWDAGRRLLLYCLMGYLTLVLVYYSSGRFLTPLLPVLAVLGAQYVEQLQARWQAARRRLPRLIVSVWVVLFFVMNPFLAFLHPMEKATGWYNLGVAHENGLRFFEDSKHCYEQALEWDPNHISALLNLGVWHARHGDLLQSNRYFEKILQRDPTHPQAKTNLEINRKRME